uniref:Uncharacterized protein n=1 Tax=Myoviridae sp. ctWb16 TaxID=2827690 RepID=A0A8S5T0W8_9CAUD|nr:MAG TPA: hypothetical protein [Myoviridae sp. ctWb16]
MVKYILKNNEKFTITDELYESIIKNGGVLLFEDSSSNKTFTRDEIQELKKMLFNHIVQTTAKKINSKYGTQAKYDWYKSLSEPINPNGTDEEKTTTEATLISNELRRIFNNDIILDGLNKDFLDLLDNGGISYSLEKKTEQMADESLNRFQQNYKPELKKEKENEKQMALPLNNEENKNDVSDDEVNNETEINDEDFDNDIDIDSDKREVFIKESLKNNKIPLFDEKFKDIVGQKNIDILEDLYNNLYFCGTSKLKAKANISKLKKKYKNLDEFYDKRDEETQKLFDSATQKWWETVYKNIQQNKPNQVKFLDKMMSSVKKEDDDYDLQQEFSLKAKASADIIKRIKDIMKNVGKVNYVNYVFTNVPNLSTVKKYYLSELQTNASYGEDRETELNKIEEIRNADNSLFQQISKRLLVHGDINEYIKVIRYDDLLDGIFTVTRTERATTMGQQRTILTFTDNSSREVMFILVVELTFGALKQFFKGIDTSGVKNAYNSLNSKL